MFKVKNGLVPSYTKEILDSAPNSLNLRNKDFHIPRFNTVRYESIPYITLDPTFGAN